jgi:hypothetical protein
MTDSWVFAEQLDIAVDADRGFLRGSHGFDAAR